MFSKKHIDGFEKYWRRRNPDTSTAVHYSSDVRIFFNWLQGRLAESITVHDVDGFIEWQQSLGRAPATIRRRLIALRIFYDYLAYACDQEVPNIVIARRHYTSQRHRLPRNLHQSEVEKLFAAIGDHLRDRTIFTLMLHAGIRVGEVVNLCLYLHRAPSQNSTGSGDDVVSALAISSSAAPVVAVFVPLAVSRLVPAVLVSAGFFLSAGWKYDLDRNSCQHIS